MVALTDPVVKIIKHHETSKVLTTVSPSGKPHAIVCGSLGLVEPNIIVISEVFMHRASEYIRNDPRVEFLVWKGKSAYFIKAIAKERFDQGPVFDRMSPYLERFGMIAVSV